MVVKVGECSWFSDFMGGIFTVLTTPIRWIVPNNPTLRKNNPWVKKAWEEEEEKKKEEERFYRKVIRDEPLRIVEGPPGPKGDAGPIGPQGKDGKDIPLSLLQRLKKEITEDIKKEIPENLLSELKIIRKFLNKQKKPVSSKKVGDIGALIGLKEFFCQMGKGIVSNILGSGFTPTKFFFDFIISFFSAFFTSDTVFKYFFIQKD
jgi:hypothetical protein